MRIKAEGEDEREGEEQRKLLTEAGTFQTRPRKIERGMERGKEGGVDRGESHQQYQEGKETIVIDQG
jgi:hypothetical protein